jgi:hypothetical protein
MAATHNPAVPRQRSRRAICAWCTLEFDTILELLDHVDVGHLTARPEAA